MSDGAGFDAEQEVRFALVLYGGVSLAIYMYGIAEEFLHLVRSTAPKERVAERAWRARSPIPSPRAPRRSIASSATAAIRREFRPPRARAHALRGRRDLGHLGRGINGVCLAKALANGTSLAGLKKVWLNDGDIGGLFNDRRLRRTRPAPTARRS